MTESSEGTAQLEGRVNLRHQLSEGQQKQLKRLVKEFAEVFSEASERTRG